MISKVTSDLSDESSKELFSSLNVILKKKLNNVNRLALVFSISRLPKCLF